MKAKQDMIDKIDVEELIRDFKVLNIDTFSIYLKEVWRVSPYLNLFKGSSSKIR